MSLIEVGATAPEFTAAVIGGGYVEETTISLADFKGSKVALVFYPKDATPGCTTQLCALRDNWASVEGQIKVIGVSPDTIRKHSNWIKKQEFPMPLLSDNENEVATAYGVWVEKKMYGKTFMGIQRSTFIIDEEGKIAAVFPKVKPAEHLDQLKEFLAGA